MHSYHADIHEVGLQDDCVECQHHAANPFANLDHTMLSDLTMLTLGMREGSAEKYPRTTNEAIARVQVMNALERVGRVMEVMQLTGNLDHVKEYYRKYWRIEI